MERVKVKITLRNAIVITKRDVEVSHYSFFTSALDESG
jgi:hypothetical protein